MHLNGTMFSTRKFMHFVMQSIHCLPQEAVSALALYTEEAYGPYVIGAGVGGGCKPFKDTTLSGMSI